MNTKSFRTYSNILRNKCKVTIRDTDTETHMFTYLSSGVLRFNYNGPMDYQLYMKVITCIHEYI
jgi:hypothetical protein